MRRETCTIIMIVMFLSLSLYPISQADASGSGDWTFMVYSCGDCDLEGYQLSYMRQMAGVGSTADVNIVVQMDRIGDYSPEYGDWTDCKRFYISKTVTPTAENAVDSLGEVNMGSPNTLVDFLVWAAQEYPADRYFLMMIGHGWIDGVCPDWTNDDILTPLEIRWALSQARNVTGLKVDILGIEACQQAALEIAYEIGDYADLFIASEEVSTHWPYGSILSDLVNASDTMSISSVASMIVDYYSTSSVLTGGNIMTLSAFNLSRVKNDVALATTDLADCLIANITRYAHAIAEAATRAESHKPLYSTEEAASCRDLYDFALEIKRVIPEASVQLAAQRLIAAIENSRIAEWHGRGHPSFHGLYIYLPNSEEVYDARRSIYNEHYATAHPLWTQDSNWDELLFRLFKTYGLGLGSREQIIESLSTLFDSNNDNYLDSLHIGLNVCTNGDPIDVVADGFLIDPQGNIVDQNNCTWTVNSDGETGDINLHMPVEGLEGLYSAKVTVYDEYGVFEDEVFLQQVAVLPEEMQHAVSVESIALPKTIIGVGYLAMVEVTVRNDGNCQEFLNVTTYAKGTLINMTQLVVSSWGSATLTIDWNTLGIELGNYTVASFVEFVDGEANTTDNFLLCNEELCVSIPGDMDTDHDVDFLDIARLTDAYGTVEAQLGYEVNHDINWDGCIDILDIVVATGNYGIGP